MCPLSRLPPIPSDIPWPTREWATGALEPAAARVADEVRDALFSADSQNRCGDTSALLAVRCGNLVFEHYGSGVASTQTLRSWSMAKSVVHALAGILLGEGRIRLDDRARVPQWQSPGDERASITIEHLLRMTDGLSFQEDWAAGTHNDVIDMLYQSGSADTAEYARQRPAAHPPGGHWSYSSGSTNILCAILAEIVGGGREGMEKFMRERLFLPLGMSSARPRFDAAGSFIGSSFVFATARDFARFGLLYLRDGVWERERLLPEGWVDHARTPTPGSHGSYGAHWWLDRGGPDTFCAVGYEGQYLLLDPTRDVIVVRLGTSTPPQRERVEEALCKLVSSMPRIAVGPSPN